MKSLKLPLLLAAATTLAGAFAHAATYIAPADGGLTTGYVGAQNAMVTTDVGVAGDPILTFNVTSGYFNSNTGNQQTYTNANVVINNLTQNNGNGAAVTTFTGTVTGAGAFSLSTTAGSGQDWVFSGNMTGYSGNISIVQPNAATNAGTTLGTTTFSIFQYGGTTAGGTVAQGTVTGGILDNVAGTGTISVNNLVFNYGTDASYTKLKVTNSSIATRYGLHNLGNANIEITGVVSGAGSINKSGTGVLTLAGVNTYTGATNINAGALEITGQLGSGTYAGAIVNAGTLNYNSTANQTLSGALSGAGALIKNNTGTLTLTGATNHTGTTTINAGTLAIDFTTTRTLTGALNGAGNLVKSNTGALTLSGGGNYSGAIAINGGSISVNGALASVGSVSIAAGSTLAVGGTGTITSGAITFAGTGTITFGTLTNYTASTAISSAAVTLGGGAGSVTLNLGSGIIASNTYHLIGGGSLADASGFVLGTAPTLGARQSGGLVVTAGNLDYIVSGDAPKWTGAQSSEWSTAVIGGASNWQLIAGATATDYISGDTTLFDDTATGTAVSIAANVSPATTIFNNTTKDYTLSGAAGISGSGGLTKSGTGKLSISSQNTYTGGTTLNAGTLAVTDATSLGASSGALTFAGNSTLQALGSFTTTRNYTLNTGVTGTIDTNGFNLTQNGVISGAGSLVKTGAGTLALGAAATYTGGTTINGGTLSLGVANTANGTLAGAVAVNNGGTLQIAATDALGYTAGRGALTINSGGTVTIAAGLRATVINTITMTGGTLASVDAGDTWGNYSLFTGAGITATSDASGNAALISAQKLALQDSGGQTTFNVTRGTATPAADLIVSGSIVNMNSSTNGINKTGNGILSLTGSNSYVGATTVSAGTLALSGANTLSGALSINGTVNQTAGTTSFTSAAANAINLGYIPSSNGGVGTYNLSGGTLNVLNTVVNLSYFGNANGTLTVSGGTANLNGVNMNASASSTGNLTLTGGTLNLGAGGITNAGAGTKTINLGAGTVGAFANWSSAQTMALTNAGTGTTFNTLDSVDSVTGRTITLSGALSGAGKLIKAGAGTLALSGANTYTGGTTINAGTLSTATSTGALGTGAVTLDGGTLSVGAAGITGIASLTVNTGTLNTSSGAITTTGAFALVGGTWTLGNTVDGVTAGSFTLTGGSIDLLGFTNKSTAGTYSLIAGTGTSSLTNANFTNGDAGFTYSLDTNGDLFVTAVPEPSTYGLIGAGALAAVALVRRRRRDTKVAA